MITFVPRFYLSVQERLKALIVIFLKTLENSRGYMASRYD